MARAFDRILLAYDESPASRLAVEYACSLARMGGRLTVAHALDESRAVATAMTTSAFAAVDPSPIIASLDDEASATLHAGALACLDHGVAAEPLLLHDNAESAIVAHARSQHHDLIVLGTHARRGVPRALMGSVAEEIVRASEIPVLVVNAHVKPPRGGHPFERALVPLDASEPSRGALALAARLSGEWGIHLTLCNVYDSRDVLRKAAAFGYDVRPFQTTMRNASLKVLDDARSACATTMIVDDVVVAEGEPASAIERTAMQRNCDLIVLGTHRRRGIPRMVLGSVAESVIRSSALPVLVVPTA